MENFTMMLGYNPEVTCTAFLSKKQNVNTFYSRKPKKTIQMFLKRFVSFNYCIINPPDATSSTFF